MQITDRASGMLKDLMTKNRAEGILALWAETCCGWRPLFRLCVFDPEDEPVMINDIPVLIPEDLEERLETGTLDIIQNRLILIEPNYNCHGNCSSCHESK